MIYFIRDPEDETIKIGTTIRLSQRLQQLRSEHRSDLKLLAVQDGGLLEERALHVRFSHLKVVDEWYRCDPELIEHIAAAGRPWDGVDEAPDLPKRGSKVRVSDQLAQAIKTASALEQMSIAEFADAYLLPEVRNHYRSLVAQKAESFGMEGKP